VRFARIRSPHGPSFARLDRDVATLFDAAPWRGGKAGATVPFADGDLLCPVEPSKIICIGRNYRGHAKELGNEVPKEPLLFFKPPSSLVGPGEAIVLPRASERVEHESELGVVIGARARDVPASDAMAFVFGFTAANDVTARDLQKKDGQWTRAKGFDTFCPVGPWVVTDVDPASVRVLCRVNGAVKQDGLTTQMVFDVPTLIAYISAVMTLEPGDLILTGTPEGVSPLAPGDVCTVELEGLGPSPYVLRSPVRAP
jgi:2-keto-4-pentenoate hydratase/2-oxohepta-3-ene-1,7-dioic acid hydratase in catechol pathway